MRMVFSTAFAMSYTVSAAVVTAVSASISTPVLPVARAVAVISTPHRSADSRSAAVNSTSTCVSVSG